jgi:hypothetical protein
VFEGLLSPWHIAIIVFALFMVFGPKKIADKWDDMSHTVSHWVDDDGSGPSPDAAADTPPPPPKKEKLARRIGRWMTRRKRRRAGAS